MHRSSPLHRSIRVRKVFEKNVNQLETLIAHNLPDIAQNMVSPFAILALMLVFDWRLGLISLLPLVLAFVLQALLMQISTNSGFMQKYEDALEQMNNAGTEYVRGISVIKTFNQSVYYFKNFYTSIMHYKEFVYKYSKSWENGYAIFLALIKAGFLFLLPTALLIAGTATLDPRFFYSFVFYLAFAPVTYTMLIKIMYANSFHQRSNDALNRIEDILNAPLTKEPEKSILPQKYDIEFKNVVFSYKTEAGNSSRTAVNGITLHIPEHSLTALVGLSGGEAQRLAIALLQDAPIIVLDEATSFADAEHEYKIKKTFDVLLKDKTVIMIAHRLSSVVNADKICVINDGKIAEESTHTELVNRNGLYATMWANFQKGIEWKV